MAIASYPGHTQLFNIPLFIEKLVGTMLHGNTYLIADIYVRNIHYSSHAHPIERYCHLICRSARPIPLFHFTLLFTCACEGEEAQQTLANPGHGHWQCLHGCPHPIRSAPQQRIPQLLNVNVFANSIRQYLGHVNIVTFVPTRTHTHTHTHTHTQN